MPQQIDFTAYEYQQDQRFAPVRFLYQGSARDGWEIIREGALYLHLGPGFEAVKSLYCGICATDLNRHELPFPLPQVTGHEVVGEYQGKPVALEINVGHWHRRYEVESCWQCSHGLANHCPQRLTLGIDRLPGGFAPWVLIPERCLHELPVTVPPALGILVEPLAAAIQAVTTTPPKNGQTVAVLGPGRLGLLLVFALHSYRQQCGADFTIRALARSSRHRELCTALGCDEFVVLDKSAGRKTRPAYDIVYDTSGDPSGFELALALATGIVHVKSTHGLIAAGLQDLTRMVINEYRLKACADDGPGESQNGSLPAAITVAGIAGLNRMLAQERQLGRTLLRPGGEILMQPVSGEQSVLSRAVSDRGLEVHTSRCGSFAAAIDMLQKDNQRNRILGNDFITAEYPVAALQEAFSSARSDSGVLKVRIRHKPI